MTKMQGYYNPLIGKAGEYAVAAQLLVREMPVFFPACDVGVDLVAQNGCRIQVKSSRIRTTAKMVKQHGEGVYTFPLPQGRRSILSKTSTRFHPYPKISTKCDVVVFWGIEQNRFWVAPATLCDDTYMLVLGKQNPTNRYVGSHEELKDLVSLGYTHREIAKQFGVCRPHITMLLNHPEIIATSPSAVSLVRNCENAWEHILNFGLPEPQVEPVPIEVRSEKERE